MHWRKTIEGFLTSLLMIASPYDPDVHYAEKHSATWIGYKAHLTGTCSKKRPPLITHVEATPAPVVDPDALRPIHGSLVEGPAAGQAPGERRRRGCGPAVRQQYPSRANFTFSFLPHSGYLEQSHSRIGPVSPAGWPVTCVSVKLTSAVIPYGR